MLLYVGKQDSKPRDKAKEKGQGRDRSTEGGSGSLRCQTEG